MDEQRDRDTPTGTAPGITGASGDFIEHIGGDSGLGGTGHDDAGQATGRHPDEWDLPRQGDAMGEGPDSGGHASRASGSATGTIGGSGPMSVPTKDTEDPRQPGGGIGATGDVPGGIRQVDSTSD